MKIHLVFPHGSEAVQAAIKEMADVAGWDTTLDTAAQWAVSREPPDPDVILINAGVDCSLVDVRTGTRLSWNTVFAKRLREIRLSRPDSRIVVLFPPEKEKERGFVSALVALGIYDLYFQKEFGKEDLRLWLGKAKTLADVASYLPDAGTAQPGTSPKKIIIQQQEKSRQGIMGGLKGVFKGKQKAKEEALPVAPPAQPAQAKKIPEAEKIPEKVGKGLCLFGVESSIPGGVHADCPEELLRLARENQVWGVLIGASVRDVLKVIVDLRREVPELPIGVHGPERQEFYAAGADECFSSINSTALLRLKQRGERLKALLTKAEKDALTGCYGRRFLDTFLVEQVELYRREQIPFCILMCDLDKFKNLNDSYGHQAGDDALKKFAAFLLVRVRNGDAVIRYGGEEFVIVFPRTAKAEVLEITQRLCREWEKKNVYASTFSGGVAEFGMEGDTPEALIAAADRALYQAKEAGRNRVLPAGEEPAPPLEKRIPGCIPGAAETAEVPPQQPVTPLPVPVVRPVGIIKAVPRGQARTVAIGSFRKAVGTSVFAVALAKHLGRKGKVVLVDCDLGERSLGVRFGLSGQELAGYDWRGGCLPVITGDVMLYPLDPAMNQRTAEEQLSAVLEEAASGGGYLILDAGNNPQAWWFRVAAAHADAMLWVVKDDPVFVEQAKQRWPYRPKLQCREMVVLFGPGNGAGMEEVFVTPCLHVASVKDQSGIKKVENALRAMPLQRGPRMMVVGFDTVPEIPNVVLEVFRTAGEASAWISVNRPDAAILNEKMKGVELLEHDLNKAGVPVKKVACLDRVEIPAG